MLAGVRLTYILLEFILCINTDSVNNMKAEALKLEIFQMSKNGDPEKIIFKVISDELLIIIIVKINKTVYMHHKIILNQN